jgi:glycosyltransferase 2 family protein
MAGEVRSHRLHLVVSVLVAAGFLWWFLRGISLAAIASEIRAVRVPYVVAAVLVSLTGFVHRILRWRYLVAPLKWMPVRSLAAAVFGGWAVTAILPGRLGEVARAVLLRRREGVRASAVLGTILLERLLDVLALVMLIALSLGLGAAATGRGEESALLDAVGTGAWVVLGVLAAIAVALFLADRVPERLRAMVAVQFARLPRGVGRFGWLALEAFGTGLSGALRQAPDGMTTIRLRTAVALHTVVLWAIICAVHVLLLQAFRVDGSLLRIPPLLFLVTLGLAVPVPASLGSYHKAVQVGLTGLFGVSNETAAGYAIVSHAVTLGPPAVIGIVVLAREGLRLSAVTQADS